MRYAAGILACMLIALVGVVWAQVPTDLSDFFLPGSQPLESGNLEHPDKCDNCHGGYDLQAEPAFNWRGGMMAQAARDPFYFACVTVSNQDAPDVGDLCIRCHSPAGWLEGRSVPTDGSALNSNDREGVQCDFCHKFVKPSGIGENPYPGDADYTSGTYPQDQSYLGTITAIPSVSANGMYIVDNNNAKRGPFVDAAARHQMLYSPFHRDADLCGTCHDVSNPVYNRIGGITQMYAPNDWQTPPPSDDPYTMFPVERTFSEWTKSDYANIGVFAPQFAGNKPDGIVSTCQDCHVKDVLGAGCNKKGAPIRPDMPLHDMTGGNTVVPSWTAALWPNEVNTAALDAGVQRATEMLQKAATLTLAVQPASVGYTVTVTVTNETGHKLPSGYPEGRRIWLNVKVYDVNGGLINEFGHYDFSTGILQHDTKIYEIKPGISARLAPIVGLPAEPSFHFVLNDTIYNDNRIPPRGFTNSAYDSIQSPPVNYTYLDGQYWDDTEFSVPAEAALVVATLYYQATSKEYVEFLQTENQTNNWGNILYDLWNTTGKAAPVAMATERYQIQAIEDNQPPTAPSNLTATAVSSAQIDLAWDASTDNFSVAGYNVYRDGVQVATTIDPAYADTRLQPSTTYSYYVTAFDEAGNISTASNTATATTNQQKGGGGGKPRAISAVPHALDVYVHSNVISQPTRIDYALPQSGNVSIEVYNVMGQRVTLIYSGWKSAGVHSAMWSPAEVSSGVYFLRVKLGSEFVTRKITVLR
ncbi:MAG: T9SS type A sorting domain-containing protein [Candidatus Latescibacteria bacterium]|nr:T9SS type A sorting domain-containing protein [Candidatus Latescibacterota bacterium]NIO55204.1 T9SS type A sorting domain-containing protein [Candidatus Latescibacterota bacterium]